MFSIVDDPAGIIRSVEHSANVVLELAPAKRRLSMNGRKRPGEPTREYNFAAEHWRRRGYPIAANAGPPNRGRAS